MGTISRNDENSMRQTIFDCLIISVLGSHTNAEPKDVSSGFTNMDRYTGEEKVICGRWDAISFMVRWFFQRGHYRIPFGWKHPFAKALLELFVIISWPFFFLAILTHTFISLAGCLCGIA